MKLSESVYLAGLPIAGTAVAYLFEIGFATYHGIPSSLIQLSVSQLVGTAVLGLFCLWVLHLYFAMGIAFLARRRFLIFKFVGLGMLYASLPLLLIIGIGNETKLWLGFALLFRLPSAMGLLGTLSSADRSAPFLQRWWEKSSGDLFAPPAPTDGLDSLINLPQQWFTVVLLVVFLSVALGHRCASLGGARFLLKSDQSKALVVVYGERWFFRPVAELGQPRSSGDLLILSGDSTKELTLGPIKPTQPK